MIALMYHYVRPGHGGFPFLRYLHLESFRRQLDWIESNVGFLTREDFLQSLRDGRPRPGAVLTFDDAFSDHYKYVFPELVRRSLWGIFYVPTGVYQSQKLLDVHRLHIILGKFGGLAAMDAARQFVSDDMLIDAHVEEFRNSTYVDQDDDEATLLFKRTMNYFIDYRLRDSAIDGLMRSLPGRSISVDDFYLKQNQIKEMSAAGMVIGSHSVNHLVMSKLGRAEQIFEIENSRGFLASIIETDVETFCYPYGGFHTFTAATEAALEKAGYRYSFNVESRDVVAEDLRSRRQALPRFDCNQFPYGKAAPIGE